MTGIRDQGSADARHRPVRRTCLRCGRRFQSPHCGVRLCDWCRRSATRDNHPFADHGGSVGAQRVGVAEVRKRLNQKLREWETAL